MLEHAVANPGSRAVSMVGGAAAGGEAGPPTEGDSADTDEWAVSDEDLVRRNTGQNVLPTAVTVLRNRGKKKSRPEGGEGGCNSPRARKKGATNMARDSREVK